MCSNCVKIYRKIVLMISICKYHPEYLTSSRCVQYLCSVLVLVFRDGKDRGTDTYLGSSFCFHTSFLSGLYFQNLITFIWLPLLLVHS